MALKRTTLPKKLSTIVQDMAGSHTLSSIVILSRIKETWPIIVGTYIDRHTTIKSIKFGKLEITTESGAIRTEILARKTDIIAQINQELGVEKITDLSIF